MIAIAPVPEVLPIVIAEKPSDKRPSSESSITKEQAEPPHEVEVIELPNPIVVVAVLGAMVRVELPEMAAPIVMASVLIVKAFAPMAIEPEEPVVKVPAVMLVVLST